MSAATNRGKVRAGGTATEMVARRCRFVGAFYAEEADVGHATRGHEQANERDEAVDDVW